LQLLIYFQTETMLTPIINFIMPQFSQTVNLCYIYIYICIVAAELVVWLQLLMMYANQYNNYGMDFASDKVSNSAVNIRLGLYGMFMLLCLLTLCSLSKPRTINIIWLVLNSAVRCQSHVYMNNIMQQ